MLVWMFIAVGMFIAAVWTQEPATINGLPDPNDADAADGLSSLYRGEVRPEARPNILRTFGHPATALPAGGSLDRLWRHGCHGAEVPGGADA
jgi:hypothetical protein